MTEYRRILRPAIWGFYVVIVLEFLFMISPLALYFYSSYGPALNFLHRTPATSWLTGFFMPHFSATDSALLNASKPTGFLLAILGLLLFLFGALQIYGAKLLRRKEVTGGLYRWIRHPQYSALALLGLGTTLVWPRFLVLAAYVSMLFLYYLLARWEEEICLGKYGESYARYSERTGMFLPRAFTSWLTRLVPAGWRGRPPARVAVYLASLALALGAASLLRELSLSRISALYRDDAAILSPALLSEEELRDAYQLAVSDQRANERLRASADPAKWAVYVVPESWYLADLPLHAWGELPPDAQHGHVTPSDFDRRLYKVLFTRVRSRRPASRGREIIKTAFGRDPVVRVHVDLGRGAVTAVEAPPETVVWGDIPTPMF